MSNQRIAECMQSFFSDLWQTILSIVKIVLLSRKVEAPVKVDQYTDIVILGNGPSLRQLIETKREFLQDKALLAVNFAVLSDYFTELKPNYYLVADPIFFTSDTHCDKLFDNLSAKTTWKMELYLPVSARKSDKWVAKLAGNTHIHVRYFNMTPVEGFRSFTHWAFRNGWGSPRPRNVLIPSIMMGLRMPYENMYVAGADHSWLKEIWVNDDNVVMEDLHHFYTKDKPEQYVSKKHLHELLHSMYVAFKSYHTLQEYAVSTHRKIYNVTQGSFIDAFERKKI